MAKVCAPIIALCFHTASVDTGHRSSRSNYGRSSWPCFRSLFWGRWQMRANCLSCP